MTWKSHGRGSPCPKCGRADGWCRSTDDGAVTACRHVPGDTTKVDCNGNEVFLHFANGAARTGPGPDLPPPQWRETPASVEILDAAYRALLGALPLSDAHLEALRKRGLPGEAVERGGYSSLPSDDAVRRAAIGAVTVATGLQYLSDVPGLYRRNGSKTWHLAGSAGLLIPVRDVAGSVVALLIRTSRNAEGKYLWLAAPQDSTGCGPGSHVHVPLHDGLDLTTIRVTEGILKSDLATALSGVLTIGLPGLGSAKRAAAIIGELGTKRVLLAFDSDARSNPNVARGLTRAAETLAEAGLEVAVEVWPDDAGKGIDDVLAAGRGKQIQIHEGRAAWEKIGELRASAGAPPAPGVAARGVLEGLAARVKEGGVTVAFAPEVLAAVAELDEATGEYQQLFGSLRTTGVRLMDWQRGARKIRAANLRATRAKEKSERVARLTGDDAAREVIRASLLTRTSREGEAVVRTNVANLITIMGHDPAFKGRLGYHLLRETITIAEPIAWHPDDAPCPSTGEWTETDSTRACSFIAREYGLDLPTRFVEEAVVAVAKLRPLDPVRAYLEGCAWDSTPRVDAWLTTYFGVTDSPYARAVGMRWLISAVARALQPGCKVDCVLVLEGPQGVGKSSGLAALCEDPTWFLEDEINFGDKSAAEVLRGKWLVEIPELDKLSKYELGSIKSYVTRQQDTYRPSYGRTARDFPRRCVFAASTNEPHYLTEGENRRWWPVRVGRVDVAGIRRDRDQLWGEAVALYRAGQAWHVDTSELAGLCSAQQENRRHEDPWAAPIGAWLETRANDPRGVILAEVLGTALGMDVGRWTRGDEMRASRVVRTLGWVQGDRRRVGAVLTRPYYPAKCSDLVPTSGAEVGTQKEPVSKPCSDRSDRSDLFETLREAEEEEIASGEALGEAKDRPKGFVVDPRTELPSKKVGTVGTPSPPSPPQVVRYRVIPAEKGLQ